MTHETARTEAIRRTKALNTTHYIIDTPQGAMVLTSVPRKYEAQVTRVVRPEDVAQLEANTRKSLDVSAGPNWEKRHDQPDISL